MNLLHIEIDDTKLEIVHRILIKLMNIKAIHNTFPATTDSEFETV